MSTDTKNTDSTKYTEDLMNAVLAGFAMTFEARRLEVGLDQAKRELLVASLCALEATYFSLGGSVDKIMSVIKGATICRLAGLEMPTLQLSEDAEQEMLASLMARF